MLTEYTKFYYHALSEDKKRIYKELYDGIRAKKRMIEVRTYGKHYTIDEIQEVIVSVYNDAPSFYYVDITKGVGFMQTPMGYYVTINFLYSDSDIYAFDQQLERVVRDFCSRYITPQMTDYQKEKAIHDFLVNTVTYAHEAVYNPHGSDYAFNVLGALLKRHAVCWGISCAFKLLCDYCKVKSFVVIGDIIPKQGDAGHAWNMVKLEGESYHVDVTWDIKERGDISYCYDYLNLSDKLIKINHTWSSKLYPACTSIKLNYYYINRLFVKTLPDLSNFIASKLRANERYIAVKYVANLPSEWEIENAIQEGFGRAGCYCMCRHLIMKETHNIYIEIL